MINFIVFSGYTTNKITKMIVTFVRLEYLIGLSIILKNSFSTWGFHVDFTLNDGNSLKFSDGSFRKSHLILIRLQNSWKSLLNSDSLIFFWIGAKSRPFSKTFTLDSERTLLLYLKTVSKQKYLAKLSHWDIFGFVYRLISQVYWSSYSIIFPLIHSLSDSLP